MKYIIIIRCFPRASNVTLLKSSERYGIMQFSFSKLILTFLCLFLYVFSLMCFRTSCAICPFFSQRPFLFVLSLFVGTIGWGSSTTSSSATSSSISAGDLTRMAGQTTWYHSFQIVLRRIVAWLALLYNSSTFLAYVVRTSAIAIFFEESFPILPLSHATWSLFHSTIPFCQGERHQHDNVFSPWSLQSCLCVFGSGGYPFPYGNVWNIDWWHPVL